MSYLCGIGEGFRSVGIALDPREPALVCDGCGVTRTITDRSGLPARWFLNEKKAPGWTMKREPNEIEGLPPRRRDWCATCSEKKP